MRVKTERPVRVYQHALNVVVVLRIHDGEEEGKYVCNSLSSYAPTVGGKTSDGFIFTRPSVNPSDLYNYRRTKITSR